MKRAVILVLAAAGCTAVLGIGNVELDPGVPSGDDARPGGDGGGSAGSGDAPVCRAESCTMPPTQCHAAQGTCVDDQCFYSFADGVPCSGTVPPAECVGDVLRTYSAPGSCASGECAFPFVERTCLAGCAGGFCNTPPECTLVCDRLSECSLSISQCRTKCRDRCTRSELNQLEVCAGAACEQIAQCIDLVSCLP